MKKTLTEWLIKLIVNYAMKKLTAAQFRAWFAYLLTRLISKVKESPNKYDDQTLPILKQLLKALNAG